jgi:transcriptional regulator
MGRSHANLLRGALELLILKSLSWEPRHGYGIAEWIESATDARLLVEEGTLYPALHRLESKKWIRADWGLSENNRHAKFYELTSRGRKQLDSETAVWQEYSEAVTKALTLETSMPK